MWLYYEHLNEYGIIIFRECCGLHYDHPPAQRTNDYNSICRNEK